MSPEIAVTPATQLKFLDLIANADPVVQSVMLILALASVVCWGIVIEKIIRLSGFGAQVKRFEQAAKAQTPEPGRGAWLAETIVEAAKRQQFSAQESRSEIEAGLEKAMRLAARIELNRLQPRLRILATVGSTAPFIGLFGTVWGIINSFTAIAQQKDTSLAVVAPGIAEALIATALGLIAAIPAVVAYNQLSGSFSRVSERINLAISALANALVRTAIGNRTGN